MTKNCRAMRYTKRQSLLWGRFQPFTTDSNRLWIQSVDATDWSVSRNPVTTTPSIHQWVVVDGLVTLPRNP